MIKSHSFFFALLKLSVVCVSVRELNLINSADCLLTIDPMSVTNLKNLISDTAVETRILPSLIHSLFFPTLNKLLEDIGYAFITFYSLLFPCDGSNAHQMDRGKRYRWSDYQDLPTGNGTGTGTGGRVIQHAPQSSGESRNNNNNNNSNITPYKKRAGLDW